MSFHLPTSLEAVMTICQIPCIYTARHLEHSSAAAELSQPECARKMVTGLKQSIETESQDTSVCASSIKKKITYLITHSLHEN